MPTFIIISEQVETGRQARFFYDNQNSCLTDELGNHITAPAGLAIPPRDYTKILPSPATSKGTPNSKTSSIKKLKIQLGLHCNYDCSYCNQRQSLQQGDALSTPADVEQFLSSLPSWFDGGEDSQGTGVQIEFWGGEPFVYWKIFKPLAETLRQRYPHAQFSVITNGSLLDTEKNDWLARLGFTVAISHDGPGYHARGADPLDDPKKSAAIFDLYQKLSPLGRLSINAMMHKENASRAAINNWIVERFGSDVVIGEGTFIDPYDANGLSASIPDQPWAHHYAKQAFLELRAGLAKNMGITHDKILDFVSSIANQRSASVLGQKCGMDKTDAIAVDLKGNILTCQNVSASAIAPNGNPHRLGHVSNIASVKLNTATHWSQRSNCNSCPVLQLCKGACMFLEGELWDRACDNSFADNIAFFAAGIELLTGFVPIYIEGPQQRNRQDIFGLINPSVTTHPPPPHAKLFPFTLHRRSIIFILNWNNTEGNAAANGQLWTLKTKPALGFEYDTLSYSMGNGSKGLAKVQIPLLPEDLLRIEQWLSNNNPYQQKTDLVHGVDAHGAYLGLVPREQAVTALFAPPPTDGENYLWSFTQAQWLRQ